VSGIGKYRDGEFWLDKRRDGKSPDIWQIAGYSSKSRSVVYRSTRCRSLDDAKPILHAFAAAQRSKSRHQSVEDAQIIPHLLNYIREHGEDVMRLDTIKSSARAWIGFLMQDELGTGATVADIDKLLLARFRRWRMGPHQWAVPFGGKVYHHQSPGVSAEAVQRNLEDLRAAMRHAEAAQRFIAPKIPMLPATMRAEPRSIVLTMDQLGAIWGYSRADWPVWREISLQIATGCRPGVAMAFSPAQQWRDGIIDLQPRDKARSNKRNAIVPAIEPLQPILTGWQMLPHAPVSSRKTWWRRARAVLGLPNDIVAYTIRHTVLTHLENEGVPRGQIEAAAGHAPRGTTARHYLHYDPRNAPKLEAALTKLFEEAWQAADQWCQDHLRTKPVRGKPIAIEKKGEH
jgi:integrase